MFGLTKTTREAHRGSGIVLFLKLVTFAASDRRSKTAFLLNKVIVGAEFVCLEYEVDFL